MKLKNFLKTLCLSCAALVPAITVCSCTNDSDGGDTTGYTPIRPTVIAVTSGDHSGDVITIGTTGMDFNSSALYQCSLSFASASAGGGVATDGYTTYEESTNNAATKSLYMYLGITDLYSPSYSTSITSMEWELNRTITVFFDSRNTGYVVSDSWYNNANADLSALGYAPYTTLRFE